MVTMPPKGYFQVGLPDGYRDILNQIRENIPEYRNLSDIKLTEKAIDLMWMKAKKEILLFTEPEIEYCRKLKVEKSDVFSPGTKDIDILPPKQ